MTNTNNEDPCGNGTNVSEASLQEVSSVVVQMAEIMRSRAMEHRGELKLDSHVLDVLRDANLRSNLLDLLVSDLTPDWVDPSLWVDWHRGVAAPFDGKSLKRVENNTAGSGREVIATKKRVSKIESEVEQARRDLKRAQEKLSSLEEDLAEKRAFDKALNEFVVFEHLLSLMSGIFAMGPTWTLMRLCSSYISEEHLKRKLVFAQMDRLDEEEKIVRAEREEESDKLLTALDLWCGDYDFESDMREAMLGVLMEYKGKVPEGKKKRSRQAMKTSVSVEDVNYDRDDVLAGMSRSSN